MLDVIKKLKKTFEEALKVKLRLKNTSAKRKPQKNNPTLEFDQYCVAATLYSEAGDLDNKGITRVAETIRNRYNYYDKNKATGVSKLSYHDIVSAPNQYVGFNTYKNKTLRDFKSFEKNLSPEEKKNWDRCMVVAHQVIHGKLKTNYARGAMGFNQSSVEANKKTYKTNLVFRDDSRYINNPKKQSPHVFFGDYHILPLKNNKGKLLAKGGNPKQNDLVLLAQNKRTKSQRG